MWYLFRTEKSMFLTIFRSKIEYVPLSNRKIDVFEDFWVKNRVRTSFEPQNRCFRRFQGQKLSTYLIRTVKSMSSTIFGSKNRVEWTIFYDDYFLFSTTRVSMV